jgi:outer membrane protein OmpA-like peptidoglycan-associated protein
MKSALQTMLAAAALSLAIAGCASRPETTPRLELAESSFQQANVDPDTLQAGREALTKAQVALIEARDYYSKGRSGEYTHALRMGEGYTALAKARGGQVSADRKVTAATTERAQIISAARSRQVDVAEAATVRAQGQAAAAKSQAAAADARSTALVKELDAYEQRQSDAGVTLILRDLNFASASAALTSGAQGRLAPLVDYLAEQPSTRIRITGHTDARGNGSYNRDLSERRASSVGAYLASRGIREDRITSIGLGENTPVGDNDTASGRAMNRRVEVTILN